MITICIKKRLISSLSLPYVSSFPSWWNIDECKLAYKQNIDKYKLSNKFHRFYVMIDPFDDLLELHPFITNDVFKSNMIFFPLYLGNNI